MVERRSVQSPFLSWTTTGSTRFDARLAPFNTYRTTTFEMHTQWSTIMAGGGSLKPNLAKSVFLRYLTGKYGQA